MWKFYSSFSFGATHFSANTSLPFIQRSDWINGEVFFEPASFDNVVIDPRTRQRVANPIQFIKVLEDYLKQVRRATDKQYIRKGITWYELSLDFVLATISCNVPLVTLWRWATPFARITADISNFMRRILAANIRHGIITPKPKVFSLTPVVNCSSGLNARFIPNWGDFATIILLNIKEINCETLSCLPLYKIEPLLRSVVASFESA